MNLRQNLHLFVLGLAFAGATQAADIANGSRIYSMHCAACHGIAGDSVMPDAPKFSRGEALMQPDFVLLSSIKTGRRAMPAFFGILRDQEILDVIAHLRTLRR